MTFNFMSGSRGVLSNIARKPYRPGINMSGERRATSLIHRHEEMKEQFGVVRADIFFFFFFVRNVLTLEDDSTVMRQH